MSIHTVQIFVRFMYENKRIATNKNTFVITYKLIPIRRFELDPNEIQSNHTVDWLFTRKQKC